MPRSARSSKSLFFLLLGCALAGGCGGQKSGPATPAVNSVSRPAKDAAAISASEILKRLLATYRGATTYWDDGIVKLEFRQQGQLQGDQWPSAVKFARPNRLSLTAFQATIKCDGKDWKAAIEDPLTNNVDGQILVRPAPTKIQLNDLAADPLLYDIVASRLRRQPIQLELLLESGGLAAAFGKDVACKRLDDGEIGNRPHFRIEVPSPGGSFVFWIDQQNFLLSRLDYPVAALLPELATDPSVTDLRLSAELANATIGEKIPAAEFSMEVPPNARRMQAFVIPPRPLPSTLFGKTPGASKSGDYFFTDLEGKPVSAGDFEGKVTVLTWYHDNPACQATIEQVSLARQKFVDDAEVLFYAVATDPTSAANQQLRDRLKEWRAELPIVRDLEAFGDKAFKIELQPTIVVLDKAGRVQIFQTGGNPQLADQIVQIVERLKKGDDIAAEVLARHEKEQKQYDDLVARGGPEPGQVIELPEAVIRARSEPEHLKLKQLWTAQELKAPGNILVVEEDMQPARVFVLEGWQTVTELDHGGNVVARHTLELPEQAAVTFVRTAVDQAGKRYFVASAPLAPQWFLFDENWKLLRSYPANDQQTLQICDLQFADLGEKDGGLAILAGSVGDVGLHAVSTSGELVWRNRAFPNVVSLAITRPDDVGTWSILVSGDSGTVMRINRFGGEEPEMRVANWPIVRLIGSRFAGATQASLLALSNNDKGQLFAVGLTDKLKECWNYPLPAGVHVKPIDPIASGHLLPGHQGEWWLAGPDGSIHVITEDGELHDSFFYGAALTGLAAAHIGDKPALLIATETGVTALQID